MKTTPPVLKKTSYILCVFAMLFMSIIPALLPQRAGAAQITDRSLTLVASNSTNGGSEAGATAHHNFSFTLPSNTTVGSMRFEYCTTAADVGAATCVTPTGLLTTSATIGSTTGSFTGFTAIDNSTNGTVYVSDASPAVVTGTGTVQINTITNPNTTNYSFFVRITTWAESTPGTTLVDSGTVTASTATQIVLNGTMPESLVFCTGQQVLETASVPDCSTATAGTINFDKLFSPQDTAVAVSQMAASTNAGLGYAITVNGTTMTSGSNTITALATPSASNKNVSQFGMNLRANTNAAADCWPSSCGDVGFEILYTPADIDVASNGTNYRGEVKANYNTPDTFTYIDGDTVADSSDAHASLSFPSDSQIYTISYIVNVPGSQPAGTYTTTLTYIATATF